MAKKKTSVAKRKKNGFTVPITIATPVAMTVYRRWDEISRNVDPFEIMDRQIYEMCGFSIKFGTWKWERMKLGLFPIVGGMVAHKIATKLGVNRALASAGIPIIRI